MRPEHSRFVARITLIYAAVAALWIAFSDWFLGIVVQDHRLLTEIAVVKGWGFVGVTALLLFGLLRRGMLQLERRMDAQARTQTELRRWADAFTQCAHGVAIELPGAERVLACNPAFAQLLGRPAAEIAGRQIIEMHAPADHDHVRQSLAEADRTGRVQFEAGLLRVDGSTCPVQMDVVSVRAPGGELLYRVATAQDISARRAAEAAAQQLQERLRTIVENLTEGLLITTLDGQPLLWNRALLRMHHLPDTDAMRQALPDFRPLLDLSTLDGRTLTPAERPIERLLGGRPFRDLRLRVRHVATSERRVFSFAGSVVQDTSGRSFALFTVNDVTAQSETLEALRESEQRFRAVVENIHEVFWIRDASKNQIAYVSPAFEAIWGRKTAELTDAPLERWLETIHPDDRDRVAAAARGPCMPEQQYRVLRPDGTVRWVRDQAYVANDASGQPRRIVGVAQDITERKQLEAQFLRAQRMEAIGTLAGGIAHDLNNILAPTLMAAGLLKERIEDARDREMLGMVERSARRGAEIIRQLLTFSRGVEGSRSALQPRHVLKEIGGIIRETFPREIEFVENTPNELWPVVADATQIQQVLMNLSVNARDAMPDGGVLKITGENREIAAEDLHLSRGALPGRYVALTVADTGCGMAPDIVDRIFDPFFTTKDPGKGTGLGLSTVLGIVRSHGGFVTVYSEPGHGSSFRVYLPAGPTEPEEEILATAEPLPRGGGEMILVVDDEEPIREATRHVLEQQNYHVLTATNGREALTTFVAERDRIRLVLTDMMMPEMGGAALVRALLLMNPRLKVIATSGLDEGPRREELLALGVTEILAKPCGPKALLDSIRRALEAIEP